MPSTDSSTIQGMPEAVQYHVYKRRFVGLFAIVLLNLATGMVWLTYSSVTDAAKGFLYCDNTIITVTSILYFVAYLFVGPVSGGMFEKYGLKKSLLFGALIQVIGALVRYLAKFIEASEGNNSGRLAMTFVGQLIAAAAQPFFLNAPPKFAAMWFSESGRTTATMIGSVANGLAAAIAQLVIPVITTSKDTMGDSLLVALIVAVVAAIPVFFMHERPPTPPSPSAAEALQETVEEPFTKSLKRVYTNKQFLLLLALFGTFVGFFNAFSSLITQFSEPFGYSNDEAGYFGAAMVVAGLVGAGIAGPIVDKYKNYKALLKGGVPVVAALYVVFYFVMRKDFFIPIIIVSALLGMVSFSLLPTILELGVESTYPVTPSSSTSLLWCSGQLFAVVFLLVLDALRDNERAVNDGVNPPLIFIAVWSVAAAGLCFLFNSPYYRLEAEARIRNTSRPSEMYVEQKRSFEDIKV
ncbi:hypothetical protein BGZ73_005369 [Actinomortierella ambigua]|nr:hypothetical protein BGZ73_005369 [Actinomortierella ambigua]